MYLYTIKGAYVVADNAWDAVEIAKHRGYDASNIELVVLDELNHYEEVATLDGGSCEHFFIWTGIGYRYHFTKRCRYEEYKHEAFIIPD